MSAYTVMKHNYLNEKNKFPLVSEFANQNLKKKSCNMKNFIISCKITI
jgi:hypothetical protein